VAGPTKFCGIWSFFSCFAREDMLNRLHVVESCGRRGRKAWLQGYSN
jgi:hypothetical protein